MAARAAAWVDESPRRDATIVALVGAERVAYEGGAASLCAARTGRSATRLLMNPPSATLERAVGAEGPPSYVPVATSSCCATCPSAERRPPRPLAAPRRGRFSDGRAPPPSPKSTHAYHKTIMTRTYLHGPLVWQPPKLARTHPSSHP